jgi:hypothetical protein
MRRWRRRKPRVQRRTNRCGSCTSSQHNRAPQHGGHTSHHGGNASCPLDSKHNRRPWGALCYTCRLGRHEGGPLDGGVAPEPNAERRMTSTEPGPFRASSPPLLEISGRPLRIAADPHTDTNDVWARVRNAMANTFQSEVTRVHAAEQARLDNGCALLHQATERCRLLDRRAAERREQVRPTKPRRSWRERGRRRGRSWPGRTTRPWRSSPRRARGSLPPSGLPT